MRRSVLIVIAIIVMLFVGNIALYVAGSQLSYESVQIEKNISALRQETHLLEERVMRSSSFATLASEAEKYGYVAPSIGNVRIWYDAVASALR
jgi:hypothetical protein